MAGRELDIRGEVYPFTFVKSKLVLEQTEPDQMLKVMLDYPPSMESVPKSIREKGQEVLAINQLDNNPWETFIRKVK
ncbi:MAG: sulfurtransferase TusA family protein [Thermocrinis sp.]|nr:sulfurtransferase TusA family protein [Thermocrinis sp.]